MYENQKKQKTKTHLLSQSERWDQIVEDAVSTQSTSLQSRTQKTYSCGLWHMHRMPAQSTIQLELPFEL